MNIPSSDIASLITGSFVLYEEQASKAFVKVPIPVELRGRTPSSARLWLYQTLSSPNELAGVTVTSTTAAWSEASNLATLEAAALSAALTTATLNTDSGWKSFDVLGDETRGVREAFEQSREYATLVLHKPGYAAATSVLADVLHVGSQPEDTVKVFDALTYTPYLEVGFDGALENLAFFAGVVGN